jgi:hypothetical protein
VYTKVYSILKIIRRHRNGKKTFNLIVAITGGVAAISAGVVAYINPVYTPAIVGAIGIA